MASIVNIQSSLSAGELSPSILGRVDLDKWHSGTLTCRNFISNYRGGVMSRAGLAYVGMCKQSGNSVPPRDIPFQFSLNQGYVLEFGEVYMRIKTNGAYITEASKSCYVQADGIFSVGGHGYSVGDWVYDTGNIGFSGLTWIVVNVIDSNSFEVTDLFGNLITSATPSIGGTIARIYTVVSPYHAVDLPYLKYTQSADTMTLTCVNFDTSVEYPPYSLVRNGNTNWVFSQDTFSADITSPTGLAAKATSSGVLTTWYSYVVTAVDSATGEESVASLPVYVQNNDINVSLGSNTLSWTGVDGASSYNVYASTPSYGINVTTSSLYGFVGTALGPSFTDTNIIPDFTVVPPVHNDPFARGVISNITPTNGGSNYSQTTIGYSITTATGTGFSGNPVAANGQFVGFVIYNKGHGYAPGDTVTITDSGGGLATGYIMSATNPAPGDVWTFNDQPKTFRTTINTPASEIHIEATLALTMQNLANVLNAENDVSLSVASYTALADRVVVTYKTSGTIGNAYKLAGGTPSGATLSGGGTPGTGAAATLSIGAASHTYPSVAAYFQQRRVYASSINEPDTYWMSQPGLFSNMDSSIPVTDSDAITGTPWAQQVNGIQFMVPMPGGLVVLTGKGAWQVNGGGSAAITPSSQTANPQAYNGCNNIVPPIPINYDILYVQSKGSIFRDLAYNFYTNIYTGTDLTVLSNHLFTNRQITQAAYAEEPYKLVWAVRDDGILLCLTYLKEQEVYSWTRHDTDGLFVGVCSVTELPVDAIYVIVKRYVQGAWRYYSERMNDRVWNNVEDSFCVDSGLVTPLTYPAATLSPASPEGTGVSFVASGNVFTSGNIGDIIRVDGGKAVVTSVPSSTTAVCTILEPLTMTVPNNPSLMPIPAVQGSWSISTPITTVSGLNHLEGLVVTILADGSVVPNQEVINGSVTLQWPASLVVVGLPYICQVQTTYADVPAKDGTVQNRRKLISSVGVRVEASRGIQVGSDQPDSSSQPNYATIPWENMNEIKERTNFINAGTAVPLFTGDFYKNISSAWGVKGQVAVQQIYPLPANILAVVMYWTLGDD